MTTYQAHKAKTTSEKIVLAWLEPSQRLFTWAGPTGSVYTRVTSYYVVGVRQDATELTATSSLAGVNGAGKWYFDQATMTLSVWATGSVDPAGVWMDVTYRLFFSNAPIDLPADLVSGLDVPYDGRLQKTSKFKSKFDTDQKGIALEGTGSVTLHNNDGYFAGIYDRLTWENKACKIFSYARGLPLTEKVVLFNGVVTNKDFDDSRVTFQVKDFIYKLRTALDLPVYTSDDGTLPESLTGKPKRRLYGRVDGLLCDPLSNMRTSYELQTVSGDARTGTPITLELVSGFNSVNASDATVQYDLCAGDTLIVNGNTLKVKSLARVDIGLDTIRNVTFSRTSAFVARLAFTGIDTSLVSVGHHISLSTLSNASTDTKSKIIGLFQISTVNAAYLEFTVPVSMASLSDTFKTGVGEIAVTRDTNTNGFTLQQVSPISVIGRPATVTPTVPYRRFNRTYAAAHHALSTRSTTIVAPLTAVKFSVADVDGIYEGDTIRINGDTLSTITGLNRDAKQITVADVVLPLPTLGTSVERLGIQSVAYKGTEFTQFDDFTPDYDADIGSRLVFEPLAEFNVAPIEQLTSRVTWFNNSKQVLGANGVFRSLKVRDWICSQTDSVWYEISEKFSDNLVILNTPYTGTSGDNLTSVKQPIYIQDTSAIIADVYGRTVDDTEAGSLIITGPGIVRDLMYDAGVAGLVDDDVFDDAEIEAPYRMSLALPRTKGDDAPKILDVINLVNESVSGSLYSDLDGSILYRTLDARRSLEDATVLTDADVIDYSVDTDSSNIYRKVLVRFGNKDADTVAEKETYSVAQSESDFVLNSGIDGQVETVSTCLYIRTDAEMLSQRIKTVHELATSKVSFTVKLLMAEALLNDLVTISLDRIYGRMGTSGADFSKTGLVSSLEKDGLSCKVLIDDLGNMFNRLAVITDNDAPDYADATEIERRFSGYITDNDGLVDGEDTFNSNLIG